MGERLLVCGGRDFGAPPQSIIEQYVPREQFDEALLLAEQQRNFGMRVLNRLNLKYPVDVVIEGGALGADRIGRTWAASIPWIELITEKADWKGQGKKAGVLRNQAMLDLHNPTLVVAFPGGAGTADMVRRATKAGVRVIEVKI